MSVISKGYPITTGYTKVLDKHSSRKCLEIINKGTGMLSVVIGENPIDLNAITIPAGVSYTTPIPVWEEVHMKASNAGDVVVVADGQGG